MENEFADFLNQNWNDKYKAGVTSSSLHINSNGPPNNSPLNHVALQQYHQQSFRGGGNSSSASYENIRLAFMQHRQQSALAGQTQHTPTSPSHPIQRNPSTTAACPKLIDIHSIKNNNASVAFDCQSKCCFLFGLFLVGYPANSRYSSALTCKIRKFFASHGTLARSS